jgi:hypothetical protein
LGNFDGGVLGSYLFNGITVDGLRMAQQKNIRPDLLAGLYKRLVRLPGASTFIVPPRTLTSDVMKWKGVGIMPVFNKSEMNLRIHRVVFISIAIIMEIADMDDS